MEFRKLKNISISNLILIILNKKNADSLRKHAEIELRNRVKMSAGNLMTYYILTIK